jgi:malate dehydrogenase (oxaloacetate-decarboxylating)
MAPDAVVFACANPVPEILPDEAKAAGARIVATGRSDFPNQVNNSLVFPGLFRGVLDVRAAAITDGMVAAVAHELARAGAEGGLGEEAILPRMDADGLHERIAVAAAAAAQAEGVARVEVGPDALAAGVESTIRAARASAQALMRERLIPPAPA